MSDGIPVKWFEKINFDKYLFESDPVLLVENGAGIIIPSVVDYADIIIAACCMENGYTLVTHNTKHFIDISGLLMDDWPK